MTLNSYLNSIVLERYRGQHDAGHDHHHILRVLKNAKELAKVSSLSKRELKLLTTAVYFHDLGMEVNRRDHHVHSAKIVLADATLPSFFRGDEISLIADACHDHRSSASNPPRTVVGEILADADTLDSSSDVRMMFYRAISFRTHQAEMSERELFDECYEYLSDKFLDNGYADYTFANTVRVFGAALSEMKSILSDRARAKLVFTQVLDNIIP